MGIEGHWTLTDLEVDGEPVELTGVTVTLDAVDGHVSGSAGVNRYTGSAPTDTATVVFGPLAATMMAGPPAATAVEAAYLRALAGEADVERDGDTLVLRGDGWVARYRERDVTDAWADTHRNWRLDGGALVTERTFADFAESIEFVNRVAAAAEEANHHPDLAISWNKVTITLTSHDAGGVVTERDRSLAEVIDGL